MKIKNIFLVLLITIIFSIISMWVGGYVFLRYNHLDISFLTYHTLIDYWHEYSDNQHVKKILITCIIAQVIFSLLPLIFTIIIMMTKPKQELYGSARFANDVELKRSGLLDE